MDALSFSACSFFFRTSIFFAERRRSINLASVDDERLRLSFFLASSFSVSVYFVRQMFYKTRHDYSNFKILARKLTRKPYGLMIVSSLLKYTVLNNLTYDLLTHNQNKYTIS